MAVARPQAAPKRSHLLAQALVLFGTALLVYLPSFRAPFQFDDFGNILINKYMQLSNLGPSELARSAFQDFHENRPLSNLSLGINYYLSGYNIFSYHLVNFLILVLTAFGVWLFLKKFFSVLKLDSSRAGLAAWLAALVWVAHPVNVQAVTYIVQRHASLAGMFSVWSIYFFHLSQEREKSRLLFYGLCALFCLMAMLSKESAAVLPAIIFIYGLLFFDGLSRGWLQRNWKRALGLFIFYLAAGAMVLRPDMVQTLSRDFSYTWFTPWQKFLTGPRTMVWYFFLTLFPLPQSLSVVHEFPVSKAFFNPWSTALSSLVVCAMIALALFKVRQWKIFSFCAAWYFGNLLVESMPLPIDLVNEHRLYLASLAVLVPLAAAPVFKIRDARVAAFLVLLVAAMFGYFSYNRNVTWQSWDALWRDSVKKAPRSDLSWKNYCAIFFDETNCVTARTVCNRAEALGGKKFSTRYILGQCHLMANRPDLALKEFMDSVQLAPATMNKNFIGYKLAVANNMMGDFEDSAEWCRAIIILEPSNIQARLLLAHNYLSQKKDGEYLAELKNILQRAPDNIEARAELALALAGRGRCEESLSLIENFNLKPDDLKKIHSLCRKPE